MQPLPHPTPLEALCPGGQPPGAHPAARVIPPTQPGPSHATCRLGHQRVLCEASRGPSWLAGGGVLLTCSPNTSCVYTHRGLGPLELLGTPASQRLAQSRGLSLASQMTEFGLHSRGLSTAGRTTWPWLCSLAGGLHVWFRRVGQWFSLSQRLPRGALVAGSQQALSDGVSSRF